MEQQLNESTKFFLTYLSEVTRPIAEDISVTAAQFQKVGMRIEDVFDMDNTRQAFAMHGLGVMETAEKYGGLALFNSGKIWHKNDIP